MESGAVRPLLIIGDALLDVDVEGLVQRSCPDAPAPVVDVRQTLSRPGGAALAASLAAAEGREVTLITALGEDEAASELARLLTAARVDVVDLGLDVETPQKRRVRSGGETLLRIDSGGEGSGASVGPLTPAGRAAIGWAEAILVSDYGRGLAAHPEVRRQLAERRRGAPLVWDPHPRGAEPIAHATLATPNRAEAERFASTCPEHTQGEPAASRDGSASWGRCLARRWRAGHVCVTCAADGAVLCSAERSQRVAAPMAYEGDPCGAGDRFATAAAGALGDGADAVQAVRVGVTEASAFVREGGASSWAGVRRRPAGQTWRQRRPAAASSDVRELAHAIRAEGGTVVATGGCFDLLHAGHIGTLQAARALGDCLIVCLNSDESVARLKGPTRPLVGERDRARVLAALACVDAVTIFDEDTPARALRELEPDVWAKGGDYDPRALPERSLVEAWGGCVVALPYLDGRSTSGLLKEVAGRGAS
jgi:D-beta-D-heptose 7-phosphate kinase / D-beta-D-heptose 1-phosphate adenosyltransferase